MSDWFDGTTEISCDLDGIKQSIEDKGNHFVGIVGHMPGMTSVDLVSQTDDTVTIRTNEGLMERTGITTLDEADRVCIEFDERYQAGSRKAFSSHYREEYTKRAEGVTFHTVISIIEAPGFLGFLYRSFGSGNIGKACLQASKAHFEAIDRHR